MPRLSSKRRAKETARFVEPMQCLPVAKLPDQNYATEADAWLELGAMSVHGPPFTRRRTLPLVKRAKKRVRIFVAEKISGFIQLQRGMQ